MKKLLILMLVLGLAATANATLTLRVAPGVTLGVEPADTAYYDPADSTLTLFPSDELWIGIYNDTDYSTAAGTGQGVRYVSIDSGDPGSWTSAYSYYAPQMPAPGTDNSYYGNTFFGFFDNGVNPGDFTEYGLQYTNAWPGGTLGIGVVDAKEFHCDDEGDVTIRLWLDDTTTLLDSFIIHQVPEPATVMLLGLGGLLLRRRKGG